MIDEDIPAQIETKHAAKRDCVVRSATDSAHLDAAKVTDNSGN